MINLIGCSKENFFKLLTLMGYVSKNKNDNEKNEGFFIYKPKLIRNKKPIKSKKISKDSPFGKLSELRFR